MVGPRRAIALLTLAVAGGCAGAQDDPATRTQVTSRSVDPERAAILLYPIGAAVRSACRAEQHESAFPVLCPSRLPRATTGLRREDSPGRLRVERWPRTRAAWYGVSVTYAAPVEARGAERRDSPDRFLHLEVLGGYWRGPNPAWSLSSWLWFHARPAADPTQRLLGRRSLAGRAGMLYLGAPYSQGGGVFGGHLTFVWRERGLVYAISLHAWKPRREAVETLTRLVATLQPASEF